MTDALPDALQENLLTLLLFDDDGAALVRNTIAPDLYTSRIVRVIAQRAYAYIDQYQKAPRDHIADELEDILIQENPEADLISRTLSAAQQLSETINREYVLGKLSQFVRQQSIKVGIVRAHELVQQGDLDAAETVLEEAIKQRSMVFTPGQSLLQIAKDLAAGKNQRDPLRLGIKALDRLGLGPAKKELHTFVAAPKRGKSWWLAHCVKRALMQRWCGVVITLEMSEELWGKRELQSLFALTLRGDPFTVTRFDRDPENDGHVRGLTSLERTRPGLSDPDVLSKLVKDVEGSIWKDRLFIKQFPTGGLTLSGLTAYLDVLERLHHLQPDFVVVDYPDLMEVRSEYHRLDVGQIYKGLRGIAVDRNLAMIVASQSNRTGADARIMTDTHVAEDFSKIAISDVVITYNQTMAERLRGLARLFVANGRMEADRFMVLLAQNYSSGQFVLESVPWRDEYRNYITDDTEQQEE